jgi:hypothetical protein
MEQWFPKVEISIKEQNERHASKAAAKYATKMETKANQISMLNFYPLDADYRAHFWGHHFSVARQPHPDITNLNPAWVQRAFHPKGVLLVK